MPRMAKKKDPPDPAQGGAKKTDKHSSNRMVRLTEGYHELLKQAAKMNNRPVTWEVKVALMKHFKELGLDIPPDLE